MSNKQQILEAISAVAKRLGRSPSLAEFATQAGIPKHSVFRFFLRWNDAVRAAGLRPRRPRAVIENSALLEDWGRTVRKKQSLLSRRAYLPLGKYDPSTLEKRFGGWSAVPLAFRSFAKRKREWADVVTLLPLSKPTENPAAQSCPSLQDRRTYGNPIDFRGLCHEPVNEQGVVLLFGMIAERLGYKIESIQNAFPDCEAKRRVAPDRWQRVNIEFEFESRNFRDHGHPASGCDVIVCWRHNWDERPKNIEVVELSSIIKSLS